MGLLWASKERGLTSCYLASLTSQSQVFESQVLFIIRTATFSGSNRDHACGSRILTRLDKQTSNCGAANAG